MPFAQRLKTHADAIDHRLSALLDTHHLSHAPDRLRRAMRHALLSGGKRFRPFLVMESAALCGVSEHSAIEAALAVECVHCYSLVHDDLPAMDNDKLRRGQPTVWAAFDDWTAILVGDALVSLAFELLASPETHHDGEIRSTLIKELALASGAAGMVGGQAFDLDRDKRNEPSNVTAEHVQKLQAMKTGALIRFSCEAGAILGGVSEDLRAALRTYGAKLGYAFQIADDLLDAEGDQATVGKAVSKDAGANKATLVSLLGVEAARAELKSAREEAIAALASFGDKARWLRKAADFVIERSH